MLDQPVTRSPAPSERTRRAVLDATAALLADGHAGVTIEKIAARSGVAKTTIYRWWPGKVALFMDVFEEAAVTRFRGLRDRGSLEADLRAALVGLLALFRETVAGAALAGMITEAQLDPRSAPLFRESFAARGRVLSRRVLERARRRGELPADYDAEFAIDVMSGAIWYRLLLGHAPLDDAYAEKILRLILDSLHPAPHITDGIPWRG